MSSTIRTRLGRSCLLGLALALLFQCRAADEAAPRTPNVAAAWDVVYQVLQHPRCVNCHPSGNAPLQGEAGVLHAQSVQRGPSGRGLFAMRCETCHMEQNAPGPHMPPGAPNWQLPHPEMPLVFEGRSSGDLCRQLRDPARNGQRTPEQLVHHVEDDPLVRWGWNPGEGRAPVSVPHAAFVEAVKAWVANGCNCPD